VMGRHGKTKTQDAETGEKIVREKKKENGDRRGVRV
jgi:hypothetical protein